MYSNKNIKSAALKRQNTGSKKKATVTRAKIKANLIKRRIYRRFANTE